MIPRDEYRISITPYCNMKCVYCHNEGNFSKEVLDKQDIEKLIKNSQDLNLKSVRLTGGEPLIHPQIREICEMLSKKYALKVGINTNCIEINKLLTIINDGNIDRVVVGIDYFNNKVSKNSPVGESSQKILNNILQLKRKGCDISIASVYFGDDENKLKLIDWAIKNGIRIKIIEQVLQIKDEQITNEYNKFKNKVIKKYGEKVYVDEFNELNICISNKKMITFFHSHCAANECDICKKIHIRIAADGSINQCLYGSEKINIKDKNFKEEFKKLLEGYVGG